MSFDPDLLLQQGTDFPTKLGSILLPLTGYLKHPTAPKLALAAYI